MDPIVAEVESGVEPEPVKIPAGKVELSAFVSGKVLPIEEVPDQVFSQKDLGEGVAMEPTDSVLLVPADGTVTMVSEDSYHAHGIQLEDGAEILFHVGLDAVDVNGKGF